MADPKGNLVTPVGFRADGSIHAFELDTSDRLKVLIDALTGEVLIDAASPSLLRPIQKNTYFSNTSLPAGSSNQTIVTVPAGEYWRLKTCSMVYTGTVLGVTLTAFGYDGGNIWTVGVQNVPVSGQWTVFNFDMILEPGEQFLVAVTMATLNDDLLVSLIGEQIHD